MDHVVMWERLDTWGLEYAHIALHPLCIQGEVVLVEEGEAFSVSYRVDCDHEDRVERTSIRLFHGARHVERLFVRSAKGRWTLDGTPAPAFDGLDDVDLSITPSTNTLPLRRLALAVGRTAEVTAAWVRFPALEVLPLRQIYGRLGETSFAYAAPDLDFEAAIECDRDGIVRSYGGLWRRVR